MTQKYSILAVDDEEFNLDVIEAAFIDYDDVEITFAKNGFEALDFLQNGRFDVILLDISMPQMNGLDVLKKIREDEEYAQLPVLIVTANSEKEQEALKLGASDFISKPYDIKILCTRTLNYAKLNYYMQQVKNQNIILEEQVKNRTKELEKALQLSKDTEFEISIRLGKASESRDPETGGHIKRMSHYSKLLANLYGLSDEECEIILYAAPLHDIGKIAIEDKILLKPGRFENDEFEIMKQHAKLGAMMLNGANRFPVLKAGHVIALEHHEKYDGSGYPNGKAGEDIHLYARIVAIADVFDALSSKRCYKDPMPLEKVLSIMEKDAGTHFDPKLIKIFLKNIDKFLEIKEIFKDENCQAIYQETKIKSQKTIKILFVDDNELNRMVIEEMLTLVFPNIEIDTFENANEVLKLDINKYDMVLSDIDMPYIDGYKLNNLLRNKYNYEKPILAVTALAISGDKEKILLHGFDGYISKPIDIEELEDTIKKYI
jgi:putative two-component system response regulator